MATTNRLVGGGCGWLIVTLVFVAMVVGPSYLLSALAGKTPTPPAHPLPRPIPVQRSTLTFRTVTSAPTATAALAPTFRTVTPAPTATAALAPTFRPVTQAPRGDMADVVRVVDGDTIDVRLVGGDVERVRLLDVDTPERGCPQFAASSAFTRARVAGRTVRLVRPPGERDRGYYGRLLREVWVTYQGHEVNIGDELLAAGLAMPYVPGGPDCLAEAVGAVVAITPTAMQDLAELRRGPPPAADEAPVFGGLSGDRLARRIKAVAQAAGLGAQFSGHSGRVGMARRMVARGAPLPVVVRQGRWRPATGAAMVQRYTRAEDASAALPYLGEGA